MDTGYEQEPLLFVKVRWESETPLILLAVGSLLLVHFFEIFLIFFPHDISQLVQNFHMPAAQGRLCHMERVADLPFCFFKELKLLDQFTLLLRQFP